MQSLQSTHIQPLARVAVQHALSLCTSLTQTQQASRRQEQHCLKHTNFSSLFIFSQLRYSPRSHPGRLQHQYTCCVICFLCSLFSASMAPRREQLRALPTSTSSRTAPGQHTKQALQSKLFQVHGALRSCMHFTPKIQAKTL